jgi:hypothetical protein
MLALVDPDARHFGCLAEISHTREILARGTSAHRQLAVFNPEVARWGDACRGARCRRRLADRRNHAGAIGTPQSVSAQLKTTKIVITHPQQLVFHGEHHVRSIG